MAVRRPVGQPAGRGRRARRRRRRRAARATASPAAVASGFPDSVPAWYTGPSGASAAMTSARPPKAPMGRPPPMTLPKQREVGRDAETLLAPRPTPRRNPVITSSKISSAPTRSHAARSPSRKPGAGGTRPMLAATGSTITHGDVVVERRARRCTAPRRCRPRRVAVTPAEPDRPERGHAAAAGGQQRVAVAVVVAGELHDASPAGEAAGQADGASWSPRCRADTRRTCSQPTAPGRGWPRPARTSPLGRRAVGRAVGRGRAASPRRPRGGRGRGSMAP